MICFAAVSAAIVRAETRSSATPGRVPQRRVCVIGPRWRESRMWGAGVRMPGRQRKRSGGQSLEPLGYILSLLGICSLREACPTTRLGQAGLVICPTRASLRSPIDVRHRGRASHVATTS